ncbi:MAG: hypothetical protein K6F39_02110 [Lachnospiraceae bacterium]|nr:hypothetical protein [Lachnospiraceae bacterium]
MKNSIFDNRRKHVAVLLAAAVFMSFAGKAPYTMADETTQSDNSQSADAKISDITESCNVKWVVSGGNGFCYGMGEKPRWYSASQNGALYLIVEAGEEPRIDVTQDIVTRVSPDGSCPYIYVINTDINTARDIKFIIDDCDYRVPVSVDNIPPNAVINAVISGDSLMAVTDHTGQTAKLSTVSYNISDDASSFETIATRGEISLKISGEEVSDTKLPQSPITVSLNDIEDEDDSDSGEEVEICGGTSSKSSDQELKIIPSAGEEKEFTLNGITVTDEAGNTAQVGTSNTRIILDTLKPRVDYKAPKNYAYKEGNVYYYYGSLETEAASVEDMNLDTSSISINAVGEYDVPELTASEADDDGKVVYTYNISKKGRYQFSISADDTLNNSLCDTSSSSGDTESPILDVDPSMTDELAIDFKDENGSLISKFAGDDSGAKVYKSVNAEGYFITKNYDDVSIEVKGTGIDGESVVNTDEKSSFKKKDSNSLTYEGDFAIDGTDGLYEVKSSGFKSENFDNFFYIDNTSPVIDIDYSGGKPDSGSYYKDALKATVTVKDLTFDEDETEISYGSDVTEKPEESDWKEVDENTYEKTITFNADGHYQIEVESTDRGGNSSKRDGEPDFYVDRTAPKINVSFDNNDAENGNYYKAARTATISIDEASFDPEKVEIVKASDEGISPVPENSAFAEVGDIHRSVIKFDEDGTYGFIIRCTDRAGNEAEEYVSDEFVIDTTAPAVSFDGVKDHSANKGVVTPSITYVDENIDTERTTISYRGSNKGEVKQSSSMEVIDGGVRYTFGDLEHVKDNDDLYTLSVKAVDLAGNETEDEIRFSVNRFGSIFVVDDETAEKIKNYYVNKPFPVKIMEINVDEVNKRDISRSLEDEITVLKENRNYKVEKEGGEDAWKSYTYTVFEDNFKHDGHYGVIIHTDDAAGNTQDNSAQGKEVDFAIDQTAPKIAVSDIEENGVYKEDGHVITVNAVDNMTVSGMSVCAGKMQLVSYNEAELISANNVEKLRLPASEEPQDIIIRAHDAAGNETVLTYSNVLINKKASGGIKGSAGKSGVLGKVLPGFDSASLMGAAVAGAAGCAAAVILAVRRRKITLETKNK